MLLGWILPRTSQLKAALYQFQVKHCETEVANARHQARLQAKVEQMFNRKWYHVDAEAILKLNCYT